MAELCVRINEFTDPGCPWAYSAEPFRRRLSWLYGECLEWRVRMVGLAPCDSAQLAIKSACAWWEIIPSMNSISAFV